MDKQMFVCLVLDESGSMMNGIDGTIEGYNSYIAELKNSKAEILFTLVKFDSDHVVVVHESLPIDAVPDLDRKTYTPGAATPLYDAIGAAVKSITKMNTKNLPVMLAVLTDGYENASKEYGKEAVLKLIEAKRDLGWTIAFIGAEISNVDVVAASIGIPLGNTITYAHGDTRAAFAETSRGISAYVASGGLQTNSLFEDDDGSDGD